MTGHREKSAKANPGIQRSSFILHPAYAIIPFCAALLCLSCAPRQAVTMDPFARAVFLFYDADQGGRGVSDALLWLDLEPKKPRSVTVRVFDEHDQPLSVDAKLLNWSASENLQVEPKSGKATVKVTLLGGGEGRLMVTVENHTGEIRFRPRGG